MSDELNNDAEQTEQASGPADDVVQEAAAGDISAVVPGDAAGDSAGEVQPEEACDVPAESLPQEPAAASAVRSVEPAAEAQAEAVVPKAESSAKAKKAYVPLTDEERQRFPWYVVHVYSGFEMRAKLTLEERIRSAGMIDRFGHVVVPEERVMELVRGEKKTSTRKFFPGYILVQCQLDDDTWHLVKETPKITGFVGDSRTPVPLSDAEVQTLFRQMEGGAQKARPSVKFEQGDAVKVVDGPFADFNGTVDEVKADKGKLRVLISIFGRNTPVELDFVQVEKV